jgi:PhnB protein
MTKLHPYLNFDGNTEEVFTFYQSVFGGEFSSLVRFKDFPMEGVTIPKQHEDRIMHISLPIGDGHVLMASDTIPEFGQTINQGNNLYISVHPNSREEADRIFSGLSLGGDIEMPIGEVPWGYYGAFKDKFGVHWMVNHTAETQA